MAELTLALIGLDRIGGSFGLAVRRYTSNPKAEHKISVIGFDEDTLRRQTALKKEMIDTEARSIGAAVESADLIILSIPYGKYSGYYEAFAPDLKTGAVILDQSPIKQSAAARAKIHLPKQNGEQTAFMVTATPILNPAYLLMSDDSLESARADLFDGGTLILSPEAAVRGEAIQLVSDFAGLIGMLTHFTDPAEHDGLAVYMSVLPLLAQLGLFRTVNTHPAWEDMKRLSNRLFTLSTHGLPQYSAEDISTILEGDRTLTIRALGELIQTLEELRGILGESDPLLIGEAFGESAERYQEWDAERAKNAWKGIPTPSDQLPSSSGEMIMSRLFGRFASRGKSGH